MCIIVTTKTFVDKSKIIHFDKYDYSRVVYERAKKHVIIGCPIHGYFKQTPGKHLHGGCKKCANEALNIKTSKKYKNDFVSKAKKIHGNMYDYSETNYINSREKVTVKCSIHGKFLVSPNNHLSKKSGCSYCAIGKKSKDFSYDTDTFVKLAKTVHFNLYDYSLTNYTGCFNKVKIICQKHGEFTQTPASHLNGNGCPNCSSNISKPEVEFLNLLNIHIRNYPLPEYKSKRVDGYDPKTNTVYEFLGDFWHGNPNKFNPSDINPVNKKTYGELLNNTFCIFNKMKSFGYNIKYIWEADWYNCKNTLPLPIKEHQL